MPLPNHVPVRSPQTRTIQTRTIQTRPPRLTEASAYQPTAWTESAACRGADPELFFPGGHSSAEMELEAEAKALCRSCPVITSCLRDAMRFRENVGVWGGLNVRERRELRRVAQALAEIEPELLVSIERGAQVRPRPYERIALAWALRRRGWRRPNIGAVLGLSLSQVDHALDTARWAAVCRTEIANPVSADASLSVGRQRSDGQPS